MHLSEALYIARGWTDRSVLPCEATHDGRDVFAEAAIAAAQLAGCPIADMENEDDLLAGVRSFVAKRRAIANPVCQLDIDWQRATLGLIMQLRKDATGSFYRADRARDELPQISHSVCALANLEIREVPAASPQ